MYASKEEKNKSPFLYHRINCKEASGLKFKLESQACLFMYYSYFMTIYYVRCLHTCEHLKCIYG